MASLQAELDQLLRPAAWKALVGIKFGIGLDLWGWLIGSRLVSELQDFDLGVLGEAFFPFEPALVSGQIRGQAGCLTALLAILQELPGELAGFGVGFGFEGGDQEARFFLPGGVHGGIGSPIAVTGGVGGFGSLQTLGRAARLVNVEGFVNDGGDLGIAGLDEQAVGEDLLENGRQEVTVHLDEEGVGHGFGGHAGNPGFADQDSEVLGVGFGLAVVGLALEGIGGYGLPGGGNSAGGGRAARIAYKEGGLPVMQDDGDGLSAKAGPEGIAEAGAQVEGFGQAGSIEGLEARRGGIFSGEAGVAPEREEGGGEAEQAEAEQERQA